MRRLVYDQQYRNIRAHREWAFIPCAAWTQAVNFLYDQTRSVASLLFFIAWPA